MARETTSDQLRSDIDGGRTGDKIDFPDPAVAPLGTDAEAGGASGLADAGSERRDVGQKAPHGRLLYVAAIVLIGIMVLVVAFSAA